MWAARYNNSAAVKLLAPHEKTLTNGRPYYTALYVAIEHGNENIAKILTPYEGTQMLIWLHESRVDTRSLCKRLKTETFLVYGPIASSWVCKTNVVILR